MKMSIVVFWIVTLCTVLEDGGVTFLRKADNELQEYMELQP
jgi:hypothetical protein